MTIQQPPPSWRKCAITVQEPRRHFSKKRSVACTRRCNAGIFPQLLVLVAPSVLMPPGTLCEYCPVCESDAGLTFVHQDAKDVLQNPVKMPHFIFFYGNVGPLSCGVGLKRAWRLAYHAMLPSVLRQPHMNLYCSGAPWNIVRNVYSQALNELASRYPLELNLDVNPQSPHKNVLHKLGN